MTAVVRLRTLAAPTHRRRAAVSVLSFAAAAGLVGAPLLGAGPALAGAPVVHDAQSDAPQISLIGDSTLTGIRWYADYGELRQFNFVYDAESCRRTVERSCVSREGYRPTTVLGAMRSLDGQLGTVLVVMSGYNDPDWSIDDAIAGVLDEARAQGVEHVVWLSLRTSGDVNYSDPQEQSSLETFRQYNEQLWAAAAESSGFLQIADWAAHTDGRSSWFAHDGVHLSPAGVDALTGFITDIVDRVLAGHDVTPPAPPWTMLLPGADGPTVIAVQEALVAAGIELRGGVDGDYGDSTMVAVAAYQRTNEALNVTGAVDERTARALGIYPAGSSDDAELPTAASTATGETATGETATGEVVPSGTLAGDLAGPTDGTRVDADLAVGSTAGGDSDSADDVAWMRWAMMSVGALALAVAAVVARRRYVIAQRRVRRWARVHPATSPRRSVADLRRSGALPADSRPPAIYDHADEDEPTTGREAVAVAEPPDRRS